MFLDPSPPQATHFEMRLYFLLRLLLELEEQEQAANARLEELKVLLTLQDGLALFRADIALTSWASSIINLAISLAWLAPFLAGLASSLSGIATSLASSLTICASYLNS